MAPIWTTRLIYNPIWLMVGIFIIHDPASHHFWGGVQNLKKTYAIESCGMIQMYI